MELHNYGDCPLWHSILNVSRDAQSQSISSYVQLWGTATLLPCQVLLCHVVKLFDTALWRHTGQLPRVHQTTTNMAADRCVQSVDAWLQKAKVDEEFAKLEQVMYDITDENVCSKSIDSFQNHLTYFLKDFADYFASMRWCHTPRTVRSSYIQLYVNI